MGVVLCYGNETQGVKENDLTREMVKNEDQMDVQFQSIRAKDWIPAVDIRSRPRLITKKVTETGENYYGLVIQKDRKRVPSLNNVELAVNLARVGHRSGMEY